MEPRSSDEKTTRENGKGIIEKRTRAHEGGGDGRVLRYRKKMDEISRAFKKNLLEYKVAGFRDATKQRKDSRTKKWMHREVKEWVHQEVHSPHVGLLRGMRGLNVETLHMLRIGLVQKPFFMKGCECGMTEKKWVVVQPGYTIPIFDPEKRSEVVTIKVRVFDDAKYRYCFLPCPTKVPSYVIGPRNARIAIISESEFGAMLWYQETPGSLCVGLGGARKPIDEYTHNLLKKIGLIFISMDSDDPGKEAAVSLLKKYPQAILFRCGVSKTWEDCHIDGKASLSKIIQPYETAFDEGVLSSEEETLEKGEEEEMAAVLGRETRKRWAMGDIEFIHNRVLAGQKEWKNDSVAPKARNP
ncbi:MAG: hypothetical protein OXF02_02580 [Simkaniaceae bacterium]|nr:hypothetical protein [Simkaniaceae bacterium]